MKKIDGLDIAAERFQRRLDDAGEADRSPEAIGKALDEVASELGVDPGSKAELAARALALSLRPAVAARYVDAAAQALGMSERDLRNLVADRLERIAKQPAVARDEFIRRMTGAGGEDAPLEGNDRPRELYEIHARVPGDRPPEIESLVLHARKAEHQDLVATVQRIKDLAKGDDYPFARGDLASDPVIAPLLAEGRVLTSDERRTLIEAVLARGTITDVKYKSRSTSDTYVVTFAEKLDGQPIQAIGKPERCSRGVPTFARTVLQYQRDRLIGTGQVPPSIEAVMSFDGGATRELCSLMFCLRNANALYEVPGKLEELTKTAEGQRQMRHFKLGLYLGDDLDHFPDGAGHYSGWQNYANTMLETTAQGPELRQIDTEYSYGMPPVEVDSSILPETADSSVRRRLAAIAPSEMGELAKDWVPDQAAARAEARWAFAQQHFEHDVGAAKALIEKRLKSYPNVIGTPEGEVRRIERGIAQAVVGSSLRYGRALIVADTRRGTANVVEGGFLNYYEGEQRQYQDPRIWRPSVEYGFSIIGGVPLEDAHLDPDGVRLQRFDGGYLLWNAKCGELRARNLDQLIRGTLAEHTNWGAPGGEPNLFESGYSVPLTGGGLYLGRGLLTIDPKSDACHMVDGFLDMYLATWADGRPGHAVLGLPTSNQEHEASTGREIQRFEHGWLSWRDDEGLMAHLASDPYGR